MMKTLFASAAALLATSVFAGTGHFSYPNANGVVVAGPRFGPDVQICYYEDDVFDTSLPASVQTIVPVWECDTVPVYGARAPVWYFFKHASPVRVSNARWAYALKKDSHHDQDDHNSVVEAAVEIIDTGRGVGQASQSVEERDGGYVHSGNHDPHTLGFDALYMERFELFDWESLAD